MTKEEGNCDYYDSYNQTCRRSDVPKEPCEDCISRDAVQNYVESHIQEINTGYGDLNKHTNEILRMIVDYIEKMESVTPQPEKRTEERTETHACDCISRENAEMCLTADITDMTIEEYISMVGDRLKGLSSIQPKPKTGRWIGHREHCENLGVMPSGLGAYEWCSNCDCGIDVREWHRNNYNFCPNCGVKMSEIPTGSEKG